MDMRHHSWWFWMVRASSTAVFALIAILYPPLTSALALHLYGAYVKLDGFLLIALYASGRDRGAWLLMAGLAAIAAGITILVWPATGGAGIAYTLAALSVLRGLFEVANALVSEARSWERVLRLSSAALIITFGLMLGIYDTLGLNLLIVGFALQATLAAVCQLAVGLEQRSQTPQLPPPRPRKVRARTPIGGLAA